MTEKQALSTVAEPKREEERARISDDTSILSVDVEDWFHILDVPSTPPLSAWESLPSHVESNFLTLLDLFDEWGAKTTCFFLGWVGERYPRLVREAHTRGHEIASHGYDHRLVTSHTRESFREDAARARRVLEDQTGAPVFGYRSAGFSVSERTRWYVECLIEAGYRYDSSIFPAAREHPGLRRSPRAPYVLDTRVGPLAEFPISVVNVLGKPLCFFGGGYLRLYPYAVIRRMARRVLREGRPVVFYIHPREIDPNHPRLPMGLRRRFKTYINLRTTRKKLQRICTEFPLSTFRDYLARHGDSLPHERFDLDD